MNDQTDILPENFRSDGGFRSVQCWIERGGQRIVGFRTAQAKIPTKLQNALRSLRFKDGRWQMMLRDHLCETGVNFPVYVWQNGCWELFKEDPGHHEAKKRNKASILRAEIRAMDAHNRIGIRSGLAEPSALDTKPSTWRMT